MSRLKVLSSATGIIAVFALASQAVVWGQRAPKIRMLTEQEMIDMMQGSSIQASRSSNTAPMVQRVKDAMAAGTKYTMMSLDDLPDDWTVAVPVGVGGGGAWEYVRERVQKQGLTTIPDASVKAIQALSKHTGRKIDALIRFEGAAATLQTFQAASALNIPVVDACPVGRSVTERVRAVRPILDEAPELQEQLELQDELDAQGGFDDWDVFADLDQQEDEAA